MTAPTTACYEVLIDWDVDGDTVDPLEDVSARVLANPGITVELGRDLARSTGPPMIGAADFALDNRDRMLSPENASSPAYQQILPGRPVTIRALVGETDAYRSGTPYREADPYRGQASYAFVYGQLETFSQQPGYGQQSVAVSVLSTIKTLKRQIISVPMIGPLRTDTAIEYVLDAAGWPSDRRVLHVSDSILHQFWVDEQPAWDVMVQLVATEGPGSLLYQDGDGILYWKNRNHRATEARSVNVQARLTDGTVPAVAGDLFYTDLTYDPAWADIITRATIWTTWRQLAASPEVVWKHGSDLTLVDPETIIWARPSDPFMGAITPVLTTDYTISGGTATVALAWTNGAVAQLVITRTGGLPTLVGLQLRAQPYRVVGETQVESSVPNPDPTLEKTLNVDAWPELEPSHAQAICDAYVGRYAESRPKIDVTVPATDATSLRAILLLQMSDRLRIVNRHLALDTDVFIEKIRHVIGRGGAHAVVLSCEPAVAIGSSGAVWDHPSSVWNGPTTLWGV